MVQVVFQQMVLQRNWRVRARRRGGCRRVSDCWGGCWPSWTAYAWKEKVLKADGLAESTEIPQQVDAARDVPAGAQYPFRGATAVEVVQLRKNLEEGVSSPSLRLASLQLAFLYEFPLNLRHEPIVED